MTGRTPQQIGRANRAAGKAWQMACAAWLRDNSYPNASYELRNGAGDVVGVNDLSIECTTEEWDKIFPKLLQAARDATKSGFDYVVWKKKKGSADPGEAAVVMRARNFWPLMADLAAYRRREMDAQLEFERGYELGRRERGTA